VKTGKYFSSSRRFTLIFPEPADIHTRATAVFRRPVA
jgi:hypothetical protein